MSKILVKDKEIVVPGDEIAEGMDFFPGFGTYREKEHIFASRLGIANVDGKVMKIIPLSGRYIPKSNDVIIGKVEEVAYFGWRINIHSAYPAMLNPKDATSDFIERGADLTRYFNIGDYLVAKIINVTTQKLVDLTTKGPGLRKISGGRIIEVNTHKVPRIIGKQGSMVGMIKQATNTRIIVGQNGLMWIEGEPKSVVIAVNATKKIEEESHISGLTERIREYLEKETGTKIDMSLLTKEKEQ